MYAICLFILLTLLISLSNRNSLLKDIFDKIIYTIINSYQIETNWNANCYIIIIMQYKLYYKNYIFHPLHWLYVINLHSTFTLPPFDLHPISTHLYPNSIQLLPNLHLHSTSIRPSTNLHSPSLCLHSTFTQSPLTFALLPFDLHICQNK